MGGLSLYSWDRCADFAAYSYKDILIIWNDKYESIFMANTVQQSPLPVVTYVHD